MEILWAIGGALAMLLAVVVAALVLALTKEETVIQYDWDLREAAADVREKIEEIEAGRINPTNATYIVKAIELEWMRLKLFPRPMK